MNFTTLLYELQEATAIVTVNRPDKMNALNATVMQELDAVFTHIANDPAVRAVILTGAGEKAFVAGADIKQLHELNLVTGKTFAEFGQSVFNKIEQLNKPVIAAVNGFALGGGSELAWSCHIRLASANAKFGQPEVNLGTIPGYGGTQRFTRLAGSGKAFEYILSGDMIPADTALSLGLVNYVYSPEELLPKAKELAAKLAGKPAVAVDCIIKAINAAKELGQNEGQKMEASLFAVSCGSEDFKEGTLAFLEKRKAAFTNK